jgi:hypothetical protein
MAGIHEQCSLNVMHVSIHGVNISVLSILCNLSSSEHAEHYKSPSHHLNRQYSDKTDQDLVHYSFVTTGKK